MSIFSRPSPLKVLIRGCVTIVVGVLFLSLPGLTLKSVIMTIGATVLVYGVFSLIFSGIKRKQGKIARSAFQDYFNILTGILLLVSPMGIVGFFSFLLGFIILMLGVSQFFGALGSLSKSVWSWIYLIFSALMTCGGLFLLFKPIESAENIMTFFGAILLLYGLLEVFNAWRLKKMPPPPGSDNTVDTTFEEV
ncbi:MAG TPA: DUF308 domain-containing protein [Prolixibacteraceae bacterium]